jgi:uncharacterized protein (DUF2062 family)
MLFRRRRKPHPVHHLRNFLWPRIGWRRSTIYISHRVARLPGTPYSIAAGFACGAAISFTPFMGFHFIGAALLAWLIGGNLLASALGTVVGNPWTFPFIWAWIYMLGHWILGLAGEGEAPVEIGIDTIFQHPVDLLLPMTLGGTLTAVVVWIAFFWPLSRMIASYQHFRMVRRAHKKQVERTEQLKQEAEREAEQEAEQEAEREA